MTLWEFCSDWGDPLKVIATARKLNILPRGGDIEMPLTDLQLHLIVRDIIDETRKENTVPTNVTVPVPHGTHGLFTTIIHGVQHNCISCKCGLVLAHVEAVEALAAFNNHRYNTR